MDLLATSERLKVRATALCKAGFHFLQQQGHRTAKPASEVFLLERPWLVIRTPPPGFFGPSSCALFVHKGCFVLNFTFQP
jgi:hypothetical protein